jgi:hypothetical protein
MSVHASIARSSSTTHVAAASALLAAALALTLCVSAHAEDRGHDEHERGRVEHRREEHRPYGYYGGPPVVYAPAPVYYGQPPGVSLNMSFPFFR